MKKKYVSVLLSLSMIASLSMTANFTKTVKVVKADEVAIEKTQEPIINEELIYSEENYKNEFAPDRVIVSVKRESEDAGAESLFDGIDIKDIKQIANCKGPQDKDMVGGESVENPLYVITLEDAGRENVLDAINTLRDNEDIRYAEPDYLVTPTSVSEEYVTEPNDPEYSRQWALQEINAPMAWNVTTGSDDVVVGVIDTGADINHPDLADNIWTNPGEVPGDGIDNDGNGFIDDVHGWNFCDNNNNINDEFDHGTHVSGIIGGVANNGIGICGVNQHVKIAVLNCTGNSRYISNNISALQYARAMGIKITNHSYSGGAYVQAEYEEFKKAGLAICAAGNENRSVDDNPVYPACFDLDNIISVAATKSYKRLAEGLSNYGANSVDLGAPGAGVYNLGNDHNYEFMSGTSMAAPHVTGAVALLQSYYPTYTPEQLKEAILNNTTDSETLHGKTVTGGLLNIAKALGVVTRFKGTEYKDVFDYDYYKSAYQDVNSTYNSCPIEALKHFVEVGMSEGRQANSEFNPRAYANRYPELKAQYGDNWEAYYMHYINTGKEDGRVGKTDFRPGDVNRDGVWNDMDLSSMEDEMNSYAVAQSEGHRYYKAEADMDFDMDIDDDDYDDLARRIRNLARPVTLLGDVNKNGVLDNSDQMAMSGALRAYAMGVSEHNPNPMYTPEADIDRDGDIDAEDADLLREMIGNL